jgi:hypothetical protein
MLLRSSGLQTLCVALVFCCVAFAAFAQGVNSVLKPAEERKSAPELGLEDSVGKQANLRDYRGKVVVLDGPTTHHSIVPALCRKARSLKQNQTCSRVGSKSPPFSVSQFRLRSGGRTMECLSENKDGTSRPLVDN